MVTTQIPTKNWHEKLADPTLADAICDRVIHNAHVIAIRGGPRSERRKACSPTRLNPPPAPPKLVASLRSGSEPDRVPRSIRNHRPDHAGTSAQILQNTQSEEKDGNPSPKIVVARGRVIGGDGCGWFSIRRWMAPLGRDPWGTERPCWARHGLGHWDCSVSSKRRSASRGPEVRPKGPSDVRASLAQATKGLGVSDRQHLDTSAEVRPRAPALRGFRGHRTSPDGRRGQSYRVLGSEKPRENSRASRTRFRTGFGTTPTKVRSPDRGTVAT